MLLTPARVHVVAADRWGRSHRRYRQFRAQIIAQAQADAANGARIACHLCPQPIDPWQPYAAGRNPAAPTIEHITPLIHGGALMDPANIALAHKGCQNKQGNEIAHARQAAPAPVRYSRAW